MMGDVVRRTQIIDLARSVPLGVLLPIETSVVLTIAIKQFAAPGLVKGLVASAAGFGMLLSPFLTAFARRLGRPVMQVSAAMSVLAAVGYATASSGQLVLLVFGTLVAGAGFNSVIPLLTVTYQRNFPVSERGKRVGLGLSVKVIASVVTALTLGALLKERLDLWWVALVVGSVASLVVASCNWLMPSSPLDRVEGRSNRPWPHFELLSQDRRLRLTLTSWMLMGFGNLMLLPLRVEYLAQPKYGVNADAAKILLLTVTVPSAIRLLVLPGFGILFDRMSFFSSRIVVNLLFALYVGAFFTGRSDIGLFLGALTLGVANAGGDLMWSLWVTKFAPADRVVDYMGLHTFFTGIRAAFAPLLAFLVVARVPLLSIAWTAAALMVVASLMLLPEARAERTRNVAVL